MATYKRIILIISFFQICIVSGVVYDVPRKPASVDVADIDLDGDNDIVLGHSAHVGDYWGMISILENNGYGEFTIIDTFPTYHYEDS